MNARADLASDGEDGVGEGGGVPHHPVPGLRVSPLRARVIRQREQLVQHLHHTAMLCKKTNSVAEPQLFFTVSVSTFAKLRFQFWLRI